MIYVKDTTQNVAITLFMFMFHVRTTKQFLTTSYLHLHVNVFLECLYSIYMSFMKEHYCVWQLQMISYMHTLKTYVALDLASYWANQNNH
jgi:hypothetical protein